MSRHRGERPHEQRSDEHTELAAILDRESAGKPSMSEFIGRLESAGVGVVPSIQKSGRLNGFTFRHNGKTVRASDVGRRFSPANLMRERGLSYDPARDREALERAIERAGLHREPAEREPGARALRIERQRIRDDRYPLNAQQLDAMSDIGRFRTVAVADLARHRYAGHADDLTRDLADLKRKGLVQIHSTFNRHSGRTYRVAVLTKEGAKHIRSVSAQGQRFYSGFVKENEIPHDVGIYRMYQIEAQRIAAEGAKLRRVVLDFELKDKVWSELNKGRDYKDPAYADRKAEAARAQHLPVIEGKVVYPDLRIEYETRDGEQSRCDLELASDKYKASQVRQKVAAGFRIYGPHSSPKAAALHDPEIISGLISL